VRTVFFDVDTQIDFLYPAGALYVPGAEAIVDKIAALNRYAGEQGIPVVSTMDAHPEDDPEFRDWPPHCVVGTAGQTKPSATLLEKRVTVPNRPGLPAIEGAQQILLEKQELDCFSSVNLDELLRKLAADRYVVYGVVAEICVLRAVMGLLKTGARVELVTDAVCSLSDAERDKFLCDITAAGGVLTESAAATGPVLQPS
jgi:nicotinamidase/pyrazinamidase